jgi:NAD(P)-dependent dehydrogenase (short-subunit alcohol dehydrogenase family)
VTGQSIEPDWPVCVVTGAASGVGQQAVWQLADRGYRIVATDVNSGGLENTVAEISSRSPGSAVAVPADLTDEAAVRRVVARAVDTFGSMRWPMLPVTPSASRSPRPPWATGTR